MLVCEMEKITHSSLTLITVVANILSNRTLVVIAAAFGNLCMLSFDMQERQAAETTLFFLIFTQNKLIYT